MNNLENLIAQTREASQAEIKRIQLNEEKKVSFLDAVNAMYPVLVDTLTKHLSQ